MDDKEIYNLIDKKNETQFSTIENMFQGITNLITVENKDMRTSIDNLTIKVHQQNGSVRDLKEWKAKHIGCHEGMDTANNSNEAKKNVRWGKLFNVIMAIIGVAALVYAAYNSRNTLEITKTDSKKIDNFGVPFVTNSRTGVILALPDSTRIRFFPNDSITYTIIKK